MDENKNTNKSTQNDWRSREIGALWKQLDGSSPHCTGYIVDTNGQKIRVIMFPNNDKNGENEKIPDFRIYLTKEHPKKNIDPFELNRNGIKFVPVTKEVEDDEDVPF